MSDSPINVPIPNIAELAANTARHLQHELAAAAQAAGPLGLNSADLELARSNIKALAFADGLSIYGAYRYLRDFIARQAVPIWSVGKILDGWLATYGMARKEASAAMRHAAGTGVNGTLVEADTVLQDEQGRRFRVQADVAVAGGVVSVALMAEVAGAQGNLAPGTSLRLVATVDGIDSEFVVSAIGLLDRDGADTEKDEQAVYRLQQRLANPPMGGCPGDYARWALEVPGITRAWGIRNPAGPTSAGVIIMADANVGTYGLPTEPQRQAVYDYIRDPRRGPPDELFVIVPTLVLVDVDLTLYPDTAATRAGALAALGDLFLREAIPGGSIPHAHLVDVVSDVVGEYNHTFNEPEIESGALFEAPTFSHLLALGSVDFTPGV